MANQFPDPIWHNGKLIPWNEAKIHIMSHVVNYGSSVFEGIRVYDGRVFLLAEHIDRLCESATAIRLEIPMTREALAKAVEETVAANKLGDGYVRLVVTRGAGTLDRAHYRRKRNR